MSTALAFNGILFFPVTPFTPGDEVDLGLLRAHVSTGVEQGAGGIFPACGTGELHALSADESTAVVRETVAAVAGAVPVIAGAGGSLGNARAQARAAADAGADGLLVLPPYLVGGPVAGLVAYIEEIAAASPLPVIVYHRGNARFTADAMRTLARNPRVIGFKDGTGDIGLAQEIVLAVTDERDDFLFFNGLLTAELSQGAYRGIGIPLYSSAAFAMAPAVARGYYDAYIAGDERTRLRFLREFYQPLVRLRDETPGFGVSLIKAGLRLGGLPVGSVRAPLIDPTAEQTERLAGILEAGSRLVAERGAELAR
jgi:5-dehydro-4-deoxyglucarate dehydratase